MGEAGARRRRGNPERAGRPTARRKETIAIWFLALGISVAAAQPAPHPMLRSSSLTFGPDSLVLEYRAPEIGRPKHALFIALDSDPLNGSAFTPFGRGDTGSTVILPFRADRLYAAHVVPSGPAKTWQEWRRSRWSGPMDVKPEFAAEVFPGRMKITVRLSALESAPKMLRVAVWAKDLTDNDGWGALLPDEPLRLRGGTGDRTIDRYYEVDLAAGTARIVSRRDRSAHRMRIYQLLPRLFSNINETRRPDGTLTENGVGKFNDIDEKALTSIKDLGCTHVWLTGVLRQATSTDYASIGLPADEPMLLKGRAGSPYAITDYFDVCPDYAVAPLQRSAEFCALLDRAHDVGLGVIIDFVPNHVARSYYSTVKPKLSFGAFDDRTKFFDPANNFFWLRPGKGGPPLRLPTDDGPLVYAPEREHGRVTGNNAAAWQPSRDDWYETVKLNYGFDFQAGTRLYPHAGAPDLPIPDTWHKMDAVLAHWQALGVDGFRCDMSHLVPPEFWSWALDRARARQPEVVFIGEAYDNDPMKVGAGNVMLDLLGAGFDAVYDDPTYKALKGIYDAGNWANDLDTALAAADREFIFTHSLRYAENHDEVRLAGHGQWGHIGPRVGRVVSAILFGVGRGPVLLYGGQEVGEPADGAEGYGGDDAHTTIFDYWSMPELAKWVNGHRYDGGRLSPEQRELRADYGRLLRLVGEPAFRDGEFYGLNFANRDQPGFGRLPGETASGHWLYAFLRSDHATGASGQRFLCVVNLHPRETLREVQIALPPGALDFIGLSAASGALLLDRLAPAEDSPPVASPLGEGVSLASIPPLTARFFELKILS